MSNPQVGSQSGDMVYFFNQSDEPVQWVTHKLAANHVIRYLCFSQSDELVQGETHKLAANQVICMSYESKTMVFVF